jgi:hypothetical protein
MIMENVPWLLPAWLIGMPFVLGVIELMRIHGLIRKERDVLNNRTAARDSGTVAPSRF